MEAAAKTSKLGDFLLTKQSMPGHFLDIVMRGCKDPELLLSNIQFNIKEGIKDRFQIETNQEGRVIFRKNKERDVVIRLFFSNYTFPVAQNSFGDEPTHCRLETITAEPSEIARIALSLPFGRNSQFSINNSSSEAEDKANQEKVKGLIDGCEKYHQSYRRNAVVKDSDPNCLRLVVGENHETESATGFIRDIMPELGKRKAVIFLEFFEWELHMMLFSRYFEAKPESAEEEDSEYLVQLAVEGIGRRWGIRSDGVNQDLFLLIKEAKSHGVRVLPAETIVSNCVSSRNRDEHWGKRCKISNYAAMKIIEGQKPRDFVVLYGNRHLIDCEQNKRLNLTSLQSSSSGEDFNVPLHHMLNARAIAFQGKVNMSLVSEDIICLRDFGEYKSKKQAVCEELFGKDLPKTAPQVSTSREGIYTTTSLWSLSAAGRPPASVGDARRGHSSDSRA